MCFFIDRLVLVGIVATACVELNELWSRRVGDDAWMNETISKQKELMALVSLLAEGSTGKSCRVLSYPCLPMVLGVTLLTSFSFAETAAAFKLSSLSADGARVTILERKETHRVVTQAIMQLLEDISVWVTGRPWSSASGWSVELHMSGGWLWPDS
jgi:hypothetical protein